MSNWSEFYQRHGKQNYTPVFNSFLDSQIADSRLDLIVRVLAWVLRNSWGRHSDDCVDADGIRLGQIDCARDLKLFNKKRQPDRQKVNPVFQELERLNALRFEGRDILPVDNPLGLDVFADSSPEVTPLSYNGRSEGETKLSRFIESVWKTAKPEAYAEYQTVERRFKELRTELMSDYKAHSGKSERGPTNEEACPEGERHDVGQGSDNASERGATIGAPSLNRTSKPSLNGAAAAFSPWEERAAEEQNAPPPAASDSGPSFEAEYAEVAEALAECEPPEHGDVRKLYANCKRRDPLATGKEIAAEVRRMAPRWRGPGLTLFYNFVPERFPLTRKLAAAPSTQQETNAGAWGTEFSRAELERELAAETDPRMRQYIQERLRELEEVGQV